MTTQDLKTNRADIMDFKIKKRFHYQGVELRLVEREESYRNSQRTHTMLRVIAAHKLLSSKHTEEMCRRNYGFTGRF